jgi:biopolymer transport protein ExbB/TolQ
MFDGIVKAFHEGGFWMYPILGCLIVVLTITLERAYVLYLQVREDKDALLRGLQKHVFHGDVHGAIRFIDAQRPGPLSRVLKAGLLKVHRNDQEVQAALDEASLREVPHLEKRVSFLAVLSNAATLFGLLGTIIGMIRCFAAVAHVDPAQKATILAAGIAEAMNCTAFGLIVAIPALLLYGVLQSRVQHITDGINEGVVTTMNLVLGNRNLYGAGADVAKTGTEAK